MTNRYQERLSAAVDPVENDVVRLFEDVQGPRQEWRRLFAELLGTFFLVLVAGGAGMMGQMFPGSVSREAAVAAPGLMVLAIILFMGRVSGAHLNPVVSLAFAAGSDFPGVGSRATSRPSWSVPAWPACSSSS